MAPYYPTFLLSPLSPDSSSNRLGSVPSTAATPSSVGPFDFTRVKTYDDFKFPPGFDVKTENSNFSKPVLLQPDVSGGLMFIESDDDNEVVEIKEVTKTTTVKTEC
jgi:hypothetical protein